MNKKPWYQWAHRWMQVNSVENDPRDCDLEVWRKYWRDNKIQGTIINAAGTVAYYPSSNPYQYRAKYLGDRDYYGDFSRLAKEEGLAVIARMDSNQATEELYAVHPDWFCKDKDGSPVRHTPGRYYTCIHGGYFKEQLAFIIKEIIEKYHPDGLADNSWAGGRGFICYCDNCRRKFKEYSGTQLPEKIDYDDRTFRVWLAWSQKCRTELYAWFNHIAMQYGGEDCVYMGMLHPDAYAKNPVQLIMDNVEYAPFNKAAMIDGQIRQTSVGFDENSLLCLNAHEIFGDDTLILESIATYQFAPNFVRKGANAREETEYWMRAAMMGGVSPSVHFIGGVQEDKRALNNGAAMFKWHIKNEEYLYNRKLMAEISLVHSLKNTCYYGKDKCVSRTIQPMNGMVAALKRARLPFFPIDARQIGDSLEKSKMLILPDIAVLTDEEIRNIETFVRRGGSLVLSGATGMLDEFGYLRKEFPLDKLLGIEREEKEPMESAIESGTTHNHPHHNYIRIAEPRHEIFKGFEETSIVSLHGIFYKVTSDKLKAVAFMVPTFPTYPPETSYMQDGEHVSKYPAILAGETGFGGRVVYFAADYDRRYGEIFFPDFGDLLKNAIVWALGEENRRFSVTGRGELECKLFSQDEYKRLILHIVNHSGTGKWPGCVEEIYPVGPEQVSVKVGNMPVVEVWVQSLDTSIDFTLENGVLSFTLQEILDQDLVIIRQRML
jgi:hypothetical protein